MRDFVRMPPELHRESQSRPVAATPKPGRGQVAQRNAHVASALGYAAPHSSRDVWRAATAQCAGPLPHRATMERLFGQSFNRVRAFFGRGEALDALGAKAATDGERVAFASHSPGPRQVAHELAHVVQMRGAAADGSRLSTPGSPAEREANRIANRAARGESVSVSETAPAALHCDFKSGGGSPQATDVPETIDGNAVAAEHGVGVKGAAVKISKLHPSMAKVIAAVAKAANALSLPTPVITSGNDSRHMRGSAHFRNRALDFRGNNITVAQGKALRTKVAADVGADYDVIFEVFADATNNHLHVEFDPG